jgi:hypothetical protein
MGRWARLAAATAILMLGAACGSSSPASSITGFGATISAWNGAHKKVANYAGFPAYGREVSTPQGKVPQFTQLMTESGRVGQFIEVLPPNSSLADAERAALAQLPPGTAPQNLVVTSSCAFWNLNSATLQSALGSPFVAVELSYEDASGSPFWLANTVNTMTFQSGKGQANDVC